VTDWYERTTLGDLVDRAAARFGDREALCFRDRRWSFAELRADVDRAARALLALGVAPGEHLCLWMPNRPEWLHLFFGAARIGAVVVPVNTRFRTLDLDYVVRQSDSTTLITVDRWGPTDFQGIARELIPELDAATPESLASGRFPELRRVIVLGAEVARGARSWEQLLPAGDAVDPALLARRQRAVDPDGTVLIMYTSGTTGFPKGVMQAHRMIRTLADGASRWGITSRDVILMYLPLFHVFGLYEGAIMSLLTGARMVLTERFDPGEALALLARERATLVHGFDTHIQDLMDHPAFPATDVSSVRLVFVPAGMATTEAVARRANKVLGPTVSGYGMTEIGTGACRTFLDASLEERCLGSGFPAPGFEFRVVDRDTGEPPPPGTPGELLVRTYAMMQGYYRKPEETAKVLDAEGWLRTGDLAVLDAHGFLRFMGRYKEMLKVGGENVDPFEAEALLLQHPAVAQVKVVGVPDPRLAEVPVACVILREGQRADAEELLAFCRGRLASFKLPRHVVFMEEFPLTSSGKVQRFELSQRARAALGRG